MSFTQQTFLGASISSFSASAGWNETNSTLNITLVEDPANGDLFLPNQTNQELAYVGKPYYFNYDSWSFGGVLQGFTYNKSTAGFIFDVTLGGPTDILDGCQVIMDGFQLAGNLDQFILKEEMPNLFNVYDYWETAPYGAFGGSQINEGGMYWFLVRSGIEGIINNYGPIKYRGVNYYIDFNGLPTPPLFYRIPGANSTLLEIISILCQDSGCDYMCRLENRNGQNWITFLSVSRATQPNLQQIQAYINSKTNVTDENKKVTANNKGLEFRNDVMSVLLLGGNREDLIVIDGINSWDNIRPFFGFGVDGTPLISDDLEDETDVTINCAAVFDILGVNSYTTKIAELRAALFNMDTWLAAVMKYNPLLADFLGLNVDDWEDYLADIIEELDKDSTTSAKLMNTTPDFMAFAGQIGSGEDLAVKINRVYECVSAVASECYGTKFVVRLPDVKVYTESETGIVKYEYEIGDSGYVPPGAAEGLIGLDSTNEALFTDEVGKFYAFARFDDVLNKDLSNVSPESSVLQDDGNTLYTDIQVDSTLINPSRTSLGGTLCIITLSAPIYNMAEVSLGDPTALAKLLGLSDAQIDKMKSVDKNSFYVRLPFSVPPKPNRPNRVAIPVKSNIYSYGPWKTGPYSEGGKVRFERDESLVPWNFAGYGGLEDYALAKIANSFTGMIIGEVGSVSEAGSPTIELGTPLKVGGPIITGISTNIQTNGITTTYSMRTYTPKFGVMALQSAERFKRLALRDSYNRKIQRQLIQKRSAVTFQAQAKRLDFLANSLSFAKRTGGTPHEGLVAYIDGSDRKDTTIATDIATHFVSKFRGNSSKGDADSEINKMGCVGWEALMRAYQVNPEGASTYLPKYVVPRNSGTAMPNQKDLNPFKSGHDVNMVLQTEDGAYKGYILKGDTEGSADNLQPIGLKTPTTVIGWGYDMNGLPTPASGTGSNMAFIGDYLKKPEQWKAGPLDLRWNQNMGIWQGGIFIYKVVLDSSLNSPGTLVDATIYKYNPDATTTDKFESTQKKMKVTTYLRNASLSAGTRCLVYGDESGYGVVHAAEC